MLQLDPFKVMLVMCHSENTFDKKRLRDEKNPMFKLTQLKLNYFIRNKKIRDFFADA
jgi:hypothetical protein